MKTAQLLLGVGLLAALSSGLARADGLRQPASIASVASESRFYALVPEKGNTSPSDASPDEAALAKPASAKSSPGQEAAPKATSCLGLDDCSCRCTCSPLCQCRACRGGCCLGEPWTLPQPCFFQKHGIRVGGWLDHGLTLNADGVADRFNGPVATNDLDQEYQMNQFWLYLDRPADTGGCGWAVGGHVDAMFGTDWRFGINHGLEDRINGFHDQTYGTVIPQMYAEVAVNKLSFKFGHFAGILDYEVVPAPFNPFYSHSYSYGYSVPQLVTGVMGKYQLNDQLTLEAGFHRGWSMFEDYNEDLDVMAGIKWTSCDKKTILAYAMSSGAQDPAGQQNRFVYSLVAQRQLTEKLRYVLVQNYGHEDDVVPGGAEWYGFNQYFLYRINPCWALNARVEWFRDDDGARVAGPGNIPGVLAWDGAGYAGDFYELTLGVNWHPRANVTFRPEVRWDWYDGLASTKPGNALPFNDGESSNQFLIGVDMIVTF